MFAARCVPPWRKEDHIRVDKQRMPRAGHGKKTVQRDRLTAVFYSNFSSHVLCDFNRSVTRDIVDDTDAYAKTVCSMNDCAQAMLKEELAIVSCDAHKQVVCHVSGSPTL